MRYRADCAGLFRLDAVDTKHCIIKYLSMAVDAVTREPCSAAFSLLTGKNAGDFAQFGRHFRRRIPADARLEPIFRQPRIPTFVFGQGI